MRTRIILVSMSNIRKIPPIIPQFSFRAYKHAEMFFTAKLQILYRKEDNHAS
jgi:hypothetical protein